MTGIAWLVPCGMLLVAAATIAAFNAWSSERLAAQRGRRIASYAERARPIAAQRGLVVGGASLALGATTSATDSRLAKLLPRASQLRDLLARSGKPVSLARYAASMGIVGGVVVLALLLLTRGSLLIALPAGMVAGVIGPLFVLRRRVKRRLAQFTAQFPDAIDLIVRALRAGLPLTEAMATISQESPDPVGSEFKNVVGALGIGKSVEEALWEMERTIDSPELRFFIISIATQIQTGGNLGETLENLSDILRQRSQMRIKVKAMTGEARASAGVLGSLPFVIALLMAFTNPGYIAPLFTDPRGWILLAGGALMLTIGVSIMAKLVSFEI